VIKIKVAVISDVHANIVALNEILKDCKINNVDEYMFTGDLINDLPFGNETLDIVKKLTNYVVKGNKEEYIIEYDKKKFDWDNIQFKNTIFMYNKLSKDNIEYIKKLPMKLSLSFENVNILLCHGSPNAVQELVREENYYIIDKYTKDLKEDILIIGHTHEKIWYKKVNNKIIINAGCAGVSPYNVEQAEYVILDINKNDVQIEKRLIKFDINKLKELIINSGILKEDKVLANLTYETIKGKGALRHSFFVEAREMMRAKNKKLYKNDATGIFTFFKLFDDDVWLSLYEKYKDEFELY